MRQPDYKRLPEHGEWTHKRRWRRWRNGRWERTRVIIPRHAAGPWYRCRDNSVFYFDPITQDFRAAIVVTDKGNAVVGDPGGAISSLTVASGATVIGLAGGNGYEYASSVVYNDGSDDYSLSAAVQIANGTRVSAEIWYLDNVSAASGSGSVTFNNTGWPTGPAKHEIAVLEVTGLDQTDSLDKTASSEARADTFDTGDTATTAQAEEVLIGIAGWFDNGTNTTGFTGDLDANYTESTRIVYAWENVSSADAFNYAATLDGKDYHAEVLATFKAVTAAPSAIAPPLSLQVM